MTCPKSIVIDRQAVGRGDIIMAMTDSGRAEQFLVVGGHPSADFWIIDQHTVPEFSEAVPLGEFWGVSPENLQRVIPVVWKIHETEFDLTIPSLEIFENSIRIYIYVQDRLVNTKEREHAIYLPNIRVWDDLGCVYEIKDYGGRWGRQIGNKAMEHEMSVTLVPSTGSAASRLNISVDEMLWRLQQLPPPPPMEKLENRQRVHMKPWTAFPRPPSM